MRDELSGPAPAAPKEPPAETRPPPTPPEFAPPPKSDDKKKSNLPVALIGVGDVGQALVRYNGFRAAVINGAPKPGYSSGEALAAMERISASTLPSTPMRSSPAEGLKFLSSWKQAEPGPKNKTPSIHSIKGWWM